MWHWPQVVGSLAIPTDDVCRVWQAVQAPTVPSSFGLPTEWHLAQPVVTAAGPSSWTSGLAGRLLAPLWYFSEKARCSAGMPFWPWTAAHDGTAWRLRRNCWYSFS